MVFTEGQRTEPDYINALKRLPHIREDVALAIEIHPDHGTPLTLVTAAVERKRNSEVDECRCLFDVEWPQNNANLAKARSLARNKDIRLAISNPCFELWLILHHEECTSWCTTEVAERRSRALDGRPGKGLGRADEYMALRQVASQRAARLAERHIGNGTDFPRGNPSWGMYLFLESLEAQTGV